MQRVMEFPYIRVFWAKQGMYRESVGSGERTNVERANTIVYLASLKVNIRTLIGTKWAHPCNTSCGFLWKDMKKKKKKPFLVLPRINQNYHLRTLENANIWLM